MSTDSITTDDQTPEVEALEAAENAEFLQSPEGQRLTQLLSGHRIPTEAEESVTAPDEPKPQSEAIPYEQRPTYNQVPYLNDDITFKDRESELSLLIQLLNFRREHAVRELQYVQNCRDQRYYPGIINQDPRIGNE